MFFKTDQANVSDARDAVKKQLLRSLIQQVVEDLNNTSSEGIDTDVADMLADPSLQPIVEDLRSSVADGIHKQLFNNLVSEAVTEMTPTEDDVEQYVEKALEEADLSSVREQVKARTMERLAKEVIPAIVQEESKAINDLMPAESEVEELVEQTMTGFELPALREEVRAQINQRVRSEVIPSLVQEETDEAASYKPSQEDVQELVEETLAGFDLPALREQVRNQVQQRIISDLIPSVVTEESKALNQSDLSEHSQRIQDAVTSIQADEVISRLRGQTAAAMSERFKQEIEEEVSGIQETLNRVKDEFVAERMEQYLFSADWASAIQEMEADVTSRVVSAIEEAVANESVFDKQVAEQVDARVSSDKPLRERLERTALDRLVGLLSDRMVSELPANETLTSELVGAVTSHEQVMAEVTAQVASLVHEYLAGESLAALSDIDRNADAAFTKVDTDHQHVTQSVEALESQLIKDISKRAVARLADPKVVQTKAMAWIPEDHALVESAVEQILEHVSAEVRKRAFKEASDTDTVVGNVLPSFTAETEEVRAAVRETRNRLVERIVTLTLHGMEDTKQVAAEANKRVANEHEHIIGAVSKAMGLLTDRVADQAVERLAAAEEVAPEAASRVPVDNEVFQRAIKATMSLLIDDIVIEVGSRMRSSEKVSSDARKRMGDEPAEVRQAAGVLENMLLQQVAEMTKERLYDVQHASEKASTFLRATKQIDAIEEAMRVKLFKGMAEQVVASIENPEKSGAEAFWHIDQQHDHIMDAMSELRNQLLFSIAKETMDTLSDAEKAADESRALIPAMSRQMVDVANKLQDKLTAEVAREAVNLMRDTEMVVEQAGAKLADHQDALDGMRRIIERHLMENLLASALTDIGSNICGMDESAERTFFRSAVRDIQNGRNSSTEVQDAPVEDVSDAVQTTSIEPDEPSTEEAAQKESAGSNEAHEAWTSIEELSESTEPQEEAAAKGRGWQVNEFRPQDREAISGAVSKNGKRTRMPKFPKHNASRSSLYVFGVVRTDDASPDDFEGIEGITDDSTVRMLSCGTLTALVSSTSDPKFSPETIKSSMSDSEWLKTHVRRHADVLSEAQNVQTVIPLRFGCVMPNPSEVKKFIDARAETLLDALTRLRNRSEFSVRVRFESEGAVSDDLAGIPAGVAEFLREAASDMDHAPNAEGIADRIHGHLARFAGEAMRNPVLEADMILNATFLITTASEEDFREEARRLSREFQALGIQIEVSGPWPPYHFVDVDFGDDLVSSMGE